MFDKCRTAHCNSNSLATGLSEQKFGLLFPEVHFGAVPEGFPSSSDSKEAACNAGDTSLIPGSGRSPGEGIATHCSIIAWRIPWTEEPGRLQSMGLQRDRPEWVANTFTLTVSKLMQFLPPSDFRFCLLSSPFCRFTNRGSGKWTWGYVCQWHSFDYCLQPVPVIMLVCYRSFQPEGGNIPSSRSMKKKHQ